MAMAVSTSCRLFSLQQGRLKGYQSLSSQHVPSFLCRKYFTNEASTQSCPQVTLYQYQICPFCNKTKALMDYASLSYESVEVNPLTKAELKPWSGDYRKVPIALLDETQINGSNQIISALLDNSEVANSLKHKWQSNSDVVDSSTPSPSTVMSMDKFRHDPSVSRWNEFADNLASILYPNICRSLGDSFDAFGYVKDVKEFSTLQKVSVQMVGSVAMYFAASKIKKKLGIQNERQALQLALDEFEKEGLDAGNKMFISGLSSPNMADIVIFGTLRSIEHLSSFKDTVNQRNSDTTKQWYERMHAELKTGEM